MSMKSEKEEADHQSKLFVKSEDMRRTTSTTSEISMDQDDDDDKETKYRLDPNYAANVRTPERHVRTRLYFTSVSMMALYLLNG
uniref:Uncharacterized protein n=1 Tax=Rhizophora mucronata TaxID=61149 RepID=A0A2P2LZT8_RHIMU